MNQRIPRYKALIRYSKILGFGEIHTKIDSETGLHAIIAVHNTKLGPAIGGCRFYSYDAPESALKDVLRLAYGMTLKAAACGLPHGGAKAVILKPKNITDLDARKAIFRSFGDFVHELNGRYITAVDVGSTVDDMTTIFERTPYVCGAKGPGRVDEDPSHSTARGVFRAMQAAVKFKLKRDDFENIHVVVQGVGHAGYHLVKYLVEHGAKVTISDINQTALEKCVTDFGVETVNPMMAEKLPCDIFSPCAMGGTITHDFIEATSAKIIAGIANNQLSHHRNALTLQARDIVYLPDFLINSGGLINAAMTYAYQDLSMVNPKVDPIYDIVLSMLERAVKTGKTTTVIAEEMAFERLLNEATIQKRA
ncbi:MAG: Glu/Leu/Phe/Val dehydrogenase [Gammaproteobacteria bacterium]|nr:Glu/Leu/Phe/Val dehydrogenase [Gammaproteobacteria bacterium]